MGIFSWMGIKIQRFRWYDISLIKIASASFALLLAKVWPPLLSLDWQVYLTIALLASLPVCYKLVR